MKDVEKTAAEQRVAMQRAQKAIDKDRSKRAAAKRVSAGKDGKKYNGALIEATDTQINKLFDKLMHPKDDKSKKVSTVIAPATTEQDSGKETPDRKTSDSDTENSGISSKSVKDDISNDAQTLEQFLAEDEEMVGDGFKASRSILDSSDDNSNNGCTPPPSGKMKTFVYIQNKIAVLVSHAYSFSIISGSKTTSDSPEPQQDSVTVIKVVKRDNTNISTQGRKRMEENRKRAKAIRDANKTEKEEKRKKDEAAKATTSNDGWITPQKRHLRIDEFGDEPEGTKFIEDFRKGRQNLKPLKKNPNFVTTTAVVRNKAERAALSGASCLECEEFIQGQGTDSEQQHFCDRFSRHRGGPHGQRYQASPENLWNNIDFPDTPEPGIVKSDSPPYPRRKHPLVNRSKKRKLENEEEKEDD